MLTISSAKMTGNPASPGWSQVYDFKPDDEEKLKLRGHLFAVIATDKFEEGLDKVVAGREILMRLHEEYFGKSQGSSFNALKLAVEKVIKEFDLPTSTVEIAAIAYTGEVVYSVAAGGSEVAILRNGMFAKILTSQKSVASSASGYPKEGDVMILGTKKFFEGQSDQNLKEALERGTPELAFEALSPLLVSGKEEGNIASSILKFQKEEAFFESLRPSEPLADKILPPKLDSFKVKIKGFSNKISSFLGKTLPQRKIYIKGPLEEDVPEKKKTTLSVGVILLVLLLVSIGFGLRQKSLKERKDKYVGRLTLAQQQFEESLNIFEVEQVRSRELFRLAKETTTTLKNEGVKDEQLETLISNLDKEQGKILGEYREEGNLYLDLSLLSSGFSGDKLSYSLGKLFVLDRNGKKIVGISVDTKKSEVVAGPDILTEVDSLTTYENRVFVIDKDGVYEIDNGKKEVIAKDWEKEVIVKAYAGNIYLLDKGGNMIWRYSGTLSGFGSKQKWLAPGITTDFSLVKEVAIDGTIWVLTSSGKVLRFSLGSPQTFSTDGALPDLTNKDSLFTSEDLKYVYFLDKVEGRVVVFDKEGVYKAQYYSEIVGSTKDFIVSEKEAKIILLTGDKLYSLELKHL